MKKFVLPGVIAAAVAIVVAIFVSGNHSSSAPSASPSTTVRANPDGLPGLLTTTQPWANNTDQIGNRLTAIGLPQLSAEGTVLHIHQHIDIYVSGQRVDTPSQIGIPTSQTFISPIHTHDDTGVIHVESPTQQDYFLGQFFDVWGLKFGATDLGGYKTDTTNFLTVYVNGTKVSTDPRKIVLAAHQEIVVVYGSATQQPTPVPSSYQFPSGE